MIKNQMCTIITLSNLEDAERVTMALNHELIKGQIIKAHLHPNNIKNRIKKETSHFSKYLYDKEANQKLLEEIKIKMSKFNKHK